MRHPLRLIVPVLALLGLIGTLLWPGGPRTAHAQGAPPAPGGARIALVIGNANYRAGALATPANDAGLIAETLRQAGFDVVGARDLDQDSIRRAFRDFLEKAQGAGPDATAFVYLSGYGLQYNGENYFVPVDATIQRDTSVPIEALRVTDFSRALAAIPMRDRIFVLDLARANPFAPQGQPLAGGLAILDPEPGTLYAFNAAPGTVGPNEPGPYGTYAQALSEMMHEGLNVDDVFAQTRLRVNERTQGLEVPWNASALTQPFAFFERAPDAPPPAVLSTEARAARTRPVRDFPQEQAYSIALERDTLNGYQDFLDAYPSGPLAKRVRALIAARREAITWEQTWRANSADAYWTYLQRYPRGPHAGDARRRLAALSQPIEPPPSFRVYTYRDLPPPPPDEVVIVDDRPYVYFDEDDYAPPPPPPTYLLAPPRREFIDIPPPPPPRQPGYLPMPVIVPMPWLRHDDRDRRPPQGQGQAQQFVPLPQGVKPPPEPVQAPVFNGGPRVGQTQPPVQPGQGRPGPGQRPPGQGLPPQQGQPAQPVPGQRAPGGPVPGQALPPQQPVPGQALPPPQPQPGQRLPGQPVPPQPQPGQALPPVPEHQGRPQPGQPAPTGGPAPQPGQALPTPGQRGLPQPGTPAVPGRPAPGGPAGQAPVAPPPAPAQPPHGLPTPGEQGRPNGQHPPQPQGQPQQPPRPVPPAQPQQTRPVPPAAQPPAGPSPQQQQQERAREQQQHQLQLQQQEQQRATQDAQRRAAEQQQKAADQARQQQQRQQQEQQQRAAEQGRQQQQQQMQQRQQQEQQQRAAQEQQRRAAEQQQRAGEQQQRQQQQMQQQRQQQQQQRQERPAPQQQHGGEHGACGRPGEPPCPH